MDFLSNIFGDAAQAFGSYQTAQATRATQQTAQATATTTSNWITIAIIGGAVLVFGLIVFLAYRK